MVVAAMMVTTSALAQFPDNVKEVLKKCNEKMASYKSDAGVVLDMNMKAKVSILSVNGTVKSYVKNKKFFNVMSMKLLNKSLNTEIGCDGEQKWTYKGSIDEGKKDSLIITKGCSDNWFKLDMDRYKNAVVVRR